MARWDDLFADLEGQLGAADAEELAAQVGALQVAAWARTPWLDRLRVLLGEQVRLRLADGSAAAGRLDALGPDWLLLDGADESLVPAAAVVELSDLPPRAEAEGSPVLARLGLAHALRRLADQAEPVLVRRIGAPDLRGRIARVGLDHLDLVADDVEPGSSRPVVTVTFAGLLAVRSL